MSQGTIWGSRDKFADKLVMRAQGQSSWAPRAVGATWGSAGGCGERQGPGDGGRRPFPFVTPFLIIPIRPSCHLGLCSAGGGCISLLVSLLIRALSSLQDRLVQGLVPGNFPGKGPAWWPTEQLCHAQPQGRRRGCAWIWAPAKSTGCPTYRNGSRT